MAAEVGFYGKLPCRGDFLRRRVSQEFLDVWDPWLQQCIASSRALLKDEWLDAYLTSPVWRFMLSEGVCGTGAYAGVIVPSVDRVGRYFPLTIVAQWGADDCALDVACRARRWFDAAEELAIRAPDTSDLEEFDGHVARLAPLTQASGSDEAGALRGLMQRSEFPHRTERWHVPLGTVNSLQSAVNALAHRELERTLRPLSIWWTDGSDRVDAGWLCARGLPAAEGFASMLSGDWKAGGWTSLDPTSRAGAARARTSVACAPDGECWTEASSLVEPSASIRLAAYHEPVSRQWDAPASTAFFVSRPEIGLWCVCGSEGIADVLQSVLPGGTLTAMVEDVRRILAGVRRQTGGGSAGTAAVVFIARGAECALVYFGDVQVIRWREREAHAVISVAELADPSVEPIPAPKVDTSGSLMELVTMPAQPAASTAQDILVRYESLRVDDLWLLASEPLFDEPHLSTISIGLQAGSRTHSEQGLRMSDAMENGVALDTAEAARALDAIRAACSSYGDAQMHPLPALIVAAMQSDTEV